MDNRRIIEEFAELFYGRRDVRTAFTRFVREDYIQHNPRFGDGRDVAIEGLTPLFGDPASTFEVLRIVVDGDLAAVHLRTHPVGRGLLAVADFYRLEDGLIVEHWDVIQPVPETANNDHPMF